MDLEYLVHEQTAKEMTMVDLNHCSFHRKFDGKLEKINLGFKDHYSDEKKMKKAFNVLGYGKIEEFIDQEDVDEELLVSDHSSSSDNEGSSESEPETISSSSESSKEEKENKKKGTLPGKVVKKENQKTIPIPGFAKAKKKKKKHN
jgi:hypothetical protein